MWLSTPTSCSHSALWTLTVLAWGIFFRTSPAVEHQEVHTDFDKIKPCSQQGNPPPAFPAHAGLGAAPVLPLCYSPHQKLSFAPTAFFLETQLSIFSCNAEFPCILVALLGISWGSHYVWRNVFLSTLCTQQRWVVYGYTQDRHKDFLIEPSGLQQ